MVGGAGMRILDANTAVGLPTGCVATIGFFDGVHQGHRYLIHKVQEVAKARGARSMVVTFDNHPRQVLCQDYVPQLLSTLQEKLMLLDATGVNDCVLLSFDRAMAACPAYDFMRDVLRDRLHVHTLVMGYDNRFGSNRNDTFEDYVRYGAALGMEVLRADPFYVDGLKVSSSVVRRLLQTGDMALANRCLGYVYTLSGTVERGFHEGHALGFPTANLEGLGREQLLPKPGVYATRLLLPGEKEGRIAMTNIGDRPTYDGTMLTIETHVLDYEGDLYGATVSLSFYQRLREECKFAGREQLRKQLEEDALRVRDYFKDLQS